MDSQPLPSFSRVQPDPWPGLRPDWHYHFLGVGGVGMSAVAEMLHRRGVKVSGSDSQDGPLLRRLASLGIPVRVGHADSALEGAQAVVYTPAVAPAHPIWSAVASRGLPRFHRAQVLGTLTQGKRLLAVSGTHGKTTSSALLGYVLAQAGWDPTVLVGGMVPQFGGPNTRAGGSPWWVVEADESDGSFVHLAPEAMLITNVEADHLDQLVSLDGVQAAFAAFAARLRPGPEGQPGLLVACGDDPGAARLKPPCGVALHYGLGPGCPVQVRVLSMQPGAMELSLRLEGREQRLVTRLMGQHNALNVAGVLAVAARLGVPLPAALQGAGSFAGVERRQQYLGHIGELAVFDDYAHHPTEIRETLRMFRAAYPGPLSVVFQPHLYSRTACFADEFARALAAADQVWVTEVYAAREAPMPGVSGRMLVERMAGHAAAHFAPRWQDLPATLLARCARPGLLLTLGAGDIQGLGPLVLREAAL